MPDAALSGIFEMMVLDGLRHSSMERHRRQLGCLPGTDDRTGEVS